MEEQGQNLVTGQHTISMADYLSLPMLSSGLCHTLLSQSPAHARWQQMHHTHPNSAMDIGSIVHQLLLEGHEEGLVIVEAKDWRTKDAKSVRDEAHTSGKIPVLEGAMKEIRQMVEVAKNYVAHSEIKGIFERGKPEQTLIWKDGEVWCKARPDFFTDDHQVVLHLKTTQVIAQPDAFIRGQLISMGYDVAVAFYERGVRALYGFQPHMRSYLLVQETNEPYACSLIALAPSLQEIAIGKVTHAMMVWGECLKSGKWPSYPTHAVYAEPRPWQIHQAADNALAWHDIQLYERLIEMVGGVV